MQNYNFKSDFKSSMSKRQIDKQATSLKCIENRGKSFMGNLLNIIPARQLSSATKKLYGFVKSHVGSVPSILSHDEQQLLPKLQIPVPRIYDDFHECQKKISEGLESFRQSLGSTDYVEEQQLLLIQTNKCYKRVPFQFFKESLSQQYLSKLMKSKYVQDAIFDLIDYLDEVEFNINQQVGHKMRTFVQFVNCLKNLKQLVELNLSKVQITRLKTNVVRDLIVHRAKNINKLRKKQQNMSKYQTFVEKFKKLKSIEQKIISSVNKQKMLSLHSEYLQIHQQLKNYCCPNKMCKFNDACSEVDKSLELYFAKSLTSYISQVIVVPRNSLKKIFKKESQFQSMPSHADTILDMSYQFEESVILTTKNNIEKDIILTFEQGMYRCSYQNKNLFGDINVLLVDYLTDFYSTLIELLAQSSKDSKILVKHCQPLQSLMKEATKYLQKISLSQYAQIFQFLYSSLLTIITRSVSIVDKLIQASIDLSFIQNQRFERIQFYFINFIKNLVTFVERTEVDFLNIRPIKQNELQLAKKIAKTCKSWQEAAVDFQRAYRFITQKGLYEMEMLFRYRTSLVKQSYDSMHTKIIGGDLIKVLQEDAYQAVMVNYRVYQLLGFILNGSQFKKEKQRTKKNMLSSSLLLDKRSSQSSQQLKIPILDSRSSYVEIQVQQNYLSIGKKSYKIIQSTQIVLDFINNYLQSAEQNANQFQEIRQKLMQLILTYINKTRQLIIKGQALKLPHPKIKAKSINAKHYCLTYCQLSLLKAICEGWHKRVGMSQDSVMLLTQNLSRIMLEVQKKFNHVLELRINSLISGTQIQKLTWLIIQDLKRTITLLNDTIMNKQQFQKFSGGNNWPKLYLEKLKINKRDVQQEILTIFQQIGQDYKNFIPSLAKQANFTL